MHRDEVSDRRTPPRRVLHLGVSLLAMLDCAPARSRYEFAGDNDASIDDASLDAFDESQSEDSADGDARGEVSDAYTATSLVVPFRATFEANTQKVERVIQTDSVGTVTVLGEEQPAFSLQTLYWSDFGLRLVHV